MKEMFDPAKEILEKVYDNLSKIRKIEEDGVYHFNSNSVGDTKYHAEVKDGKIVGDLFIETSESYAITDYEKKVVNAHFSQEGRLLKATYSKSFCDKNGQPWIVGRYDSAGDFDGGKFKVVRDQENEVPTTFQRTYELGQFVNIKNPLQVVANRRLNKKIRNWTIGLAVFGACTFGISTCSKNDSKQDKVGHQDAPAMRVLPQKNQR